MTALYEYTFKRRRISDSVPARCDAPELAYEHVKDLVNEELESLVVVVLNRKYKAIGRETLYRGTISGCSLRLAEIFRLCVRIGGAAVVLAHPHPSGDPTPSAEDVRSTRDCVTAGRLLGIDVIDHIVVGEQGWVSMRSTHQGFD